MGGLRTDRRQDALDAGVPPASSFNYARCAAVVRSVSQPNSKPIVVHMIACIPSEAIRNFQSSSVSTGPTQRVDDELLDVKFSCATGVKSMLGEIWGRACAAPDRSGGSMS
jgi:hypothetical protein